MREGKSEIFILPVTHSLSGYFQLLECVKMISLSLCLSLHHFSSFPSSLHLSLPPYFPLLLPCSLLPSLSLSLSLFLSLSLSLSLTLTLSLSLSLSLSLPLSLSHTQTGQVRNILAEVWRQLSRPCNSYP